MDSDVILVIVIATALAFDFTNGFHDTANAVATSVSTRAMAPRTAVALAAVLNFIGAFISLEVAATIANGIVEADAITETIVFAGLIEAIAWNLITWYFGLPSSSSHALIGGVAGAAFVAAGPDAVLGDGLIEKVFIPALVAPLLAFATAAMAILLTYRIVGRLRPGPVNRGYRVGQIVSGSLFSLAHGTNDAQKTMGIIALALVAHGDLAAGADPLVLGDPLRGDRDRARDLLRRLADHPDDGQPDHQDGSGAGLQRAGRRRGRDPRREPPRVPAVDDAHDLRRDHGRGRGAPALRRAVGSRGQHRARVGAHRPRRGDDRAAAWGISRIFGEGALGAVIVSLCVVRPRRRRARAPPSAWARDHRRA